ncbi:hypothetical protein DWF00_20175 [Bosea caraganae]|uniref:VCBS repeat-containing protein n=1 Tax=Bosea caraganae TaxID=2763117 RepID=A0A370L0D1_9HYPH|nr:hypothetical protein [Bosea caraganae]RDJ20312.1 hypothetical protein DWE98_25465 [Bosea caraganae]RDJ24008.1 hypothetical protein DWF00_20175 [Bosea caraganae]
MKTKNQIVSMLAVSCAAIALSTGAGHALDEQIFSVITGDRGTLPDGIGPLSAPPDGAAVVRAYKDSLTKSCAGLGGKIEFQEPFVTAVDLNADQVPDLLMSSARTNCVGAYSYDSGSAGHGVRWAVSRTDGSYTVGDTHLRKAAVEETLRNGYHVIFHFHGSACGKVGVADCRQVGRFDKDGQWQSVAWPDGRTGPALGSAQAASAASQPKAATTTDGLFNFDMLGDLSSSHGTYDHNGSMMRMAFEYGLIVYEDPKASLAGIAQKGTILFRGDPFTEGGRLRGTAVAFKKGCPPAEYPVTGTYSRDRRTVTLSGAGPVREGCKVVGYSTTSPHARLIFKSMMSD